ncbi:hypothetical protein Agabi119p4_3351 [Agaricus bisporus var. burnettii]|uniref:Uncharacterized protein n=1 Tax=Agaricus bisporus var. burnettii TaxID=192524 RepID=A0A8H7F6Y5_AGABI|nr:hypothetical protein Agabi119p4_3351 [Agaricus bisporus var. burnettii]
MVSADNGGHFYVAEYGVRVRAAANTIIAWRPKDYHGTSLFSFDGENRGKQFYQRGLSFVTSNRLPKAMQLLKEDKIKEAEEELLGADGHDEHENDVFVGILRRSPRLAKKNGKKGGGV